MGKIIQQHLNFVKLPSELSKNHQKGAELPGLHPKWSLYIVFRDGVDPVRRILHGGTGTQRSERDAAARAYATPAPCLDFLPAIPKRKRAGWAAAPFVLSAEPFPE